MKLATIRHGGAVEAAIVHPDDGIAIPLGIDMLSVVRAGGVQSVPEKGIPLDSVEILAPIPRPIRNMFCVGKNYRLHAEEFARSGFDTSISHVSEAVPEAPIIFGKVPECVIANGATILYPEGISEAIDYEAEVALVIGKGGRGIRKADAYDAVFGYMIINDVTARDLQMKHKQWLIGKSLDSFCPMGPWLVTSDEVAPQNLTVKCWVNEELRQKGNTSSFIFDIPTLIETLSAGITLYPGDIIATGTPEGVGVGFNPPRYLRKGDRVSIEINGLGRLSNVIE